MDALSKYKAKDVRDAENIVERITPRLQHANCAVVLSAVKVLCLSAVVVVPTHWWAIYSFLPVSYSAIPQRLIKGLVIEVLSCLIVIAL